MQADVVLTAAAVPCQSEALGAALERQVEAMEACPAGADGPQLLEAARQGSELPQALAAVDLALWDLAGKREGRPLVELLSDRRPGQVAVNAVIDAAEVPECARQARAAAQAGFSCVKVKVGDDGDIERVAAVRDAVGVGVWAGALSVGTASTGAASGAGVGSGVAAGTASAITVSITEERAAFWSVMG